LSGQFFLPPTAARHSGAMRPEERLNDETDFFPFLPEGEVHPLVINKHQIVELSVDVAEDAKLRDPWETENRDDGALVLPEQQVVIECAGTRLQGVLLMDTPQHQQRMLDRLNRQERFVRVRCEDRLHLVNRERIIRATDVSGT
jgi:hypothetical protein